jgi:pantothenate kinase
VVPDETPREPPGQLVERLCSFGSERSRTIIGLGGVPGAGKSTLASALANAVNARLNGPAVRIVGQDGYHLPDRALAATDRLHGKGNRDTFDVYQLVEDLRRIRRGENVACPRYDRLHHAPRPRAVHIGAGCAIVMVEGSFVLSNLVPWDRLQSLYDETWYLECSELEAKRRIARRHVRAGRSSGDIEERWKRRDGPNGMLVRRTLSAPSLIISGSRRADGRTH